MHHQYVWLRLVLWGSVYVSAWKLLWFLQGDLKLSARKPRALQAKRAGLCQSRGAVKGLSIGSWLRTRGAGEGSLHIIVLEKETTCPGVLRAAPRMFPHPTRTRACGQRGRNVRSQVRLGNRKTSCVGGRRGLQIPAGLSHLGVFFPRWPPPSPSLLIPPCN